MSVGPDITDLDGNLMDQDEDGVPGEPGEDVYQFTVIGEESQEVFNEDFELGQGAWTIDNGVWDIGTPTAGPAACHSGTQCAGTVLDGNYPGYTDSRLISAPVDLPGVAGDELLLLRFWQWFSYSSYDSGQAQISVWDAGSGSWSAWEAVGDPVVQVSGAWAQRILDLSAYAGQRIRLGFYHVAGRNAFGDASESTGWYLDDIELVVKVPAFSGDFEAGWGDWSADNGVWEIGTPTAGPAACHSGVQCAGTVLAGNYPGHTDSRLISAPVDLPGVAGDELLLLRFWQWFSYSSYDSGQAQISVWDAGSGSWSAWEPVGDPVVSISGAWTQRILDLSAYAGQRIRLSFYHVAGRNAFGDASESAGWYLDDVEFSHYVPESISIGESFNGTFANDGDRAYFVIEVPPDGHLQFLFDDLDGTGVNEVYLRHGALPSPGEYDYRFSVQGGADQEVFVPDATPGYWYVLVYTDSVGANGDYQVRTEFSTGVLISNISPYRVGNSVPAEITIDGAGFAPDAEVQLTQGSTPITADSVSFISSARLIAEFNLAGVSAGNYLLQVQSGGNADSASLQIMDGGEANLETNLIVPSRIGYHNPATIWVEYANTGEVAMRAPLLVLTATQGERQAAILKLDDKLPPRGFWTSALPEGFSNTVQFLATGDTPGILQPGETFRVPVQYAGWQKPWDFSYRHPEKDLGNVRLWR